MLANAYDLSDRLRRLRRLRWSSVRPATLPPAKLVCWRGLVAYLSAACLRVRLVDCGATAVSVRGRQTPRHDPVNTQLHSAAACHCRSPVAPLPFRIQQSEQCVAVPPAASSLLEITKIDGRWKHGCATGPSPPISRSFLPSIFSERGISSNSRETELTDAPGQTSIAVKLTSHWAFRKNQ